MAKVRIETIKIPAPDIRVLNVVVAGTSPLIVHRFAEKAKKQIEDKQGKRARGAREIRDPHAEYEAACYTLNGKGKYGFKANAFKLAMVDACAFCEGITKTFAKGVFFVMGDVLEIKGARRMRTDMVRVPPGPQGRADIRYRPEWEKWSIDLQIRYNAQLITAEQLVNLLTLAGLHVGVGEQRPSAPKKPGSNGMFEVQQKAARRKKVTA